MLSGMNPVIIMVTHLQRQKCCFRGPQAAFREAGSPRGPHSTPGQWQSPFPGTEPRLRGMDIWLEDPPEVGQWNLKAQEKGCAPNGQAGRLMSDFDLDLCIFLSPVRSAMTICDICKNRNIIYKKKQGFVRNEWGKMCPDSGRKPQPVFTWPVCVCVLHRERCFSQR